jgi:N-acetylmuramoyl-L-alanine amidase
VLRNRRKRIIIWLRPAGALKLLLAAALVALIVIIYVNEMPTTKTWSEWSMPLSGKTIVLDAGHGGPDGGASSKSGVIEKNVNLAIALYARDYLQEAGAIVYMTRERDTDLAHPDTKGLSKRKSEDLRARADFINKQNADLFLSIHGNATPSPRWFGAQTFYAPNHPDNYTLASLIQNELKRNLDNTDRVVKQMATTFLLKTLKMPSALIEVGFLTNPAEAARLNLPSYQKKVAASIYQGVLRYYSGEKVPKSS